MENTSRKDSSTGSSGYAAICKYCEEKAVAMASPLGFLGLQAAWPQHWSPAQQPFAAAASAHSCAAAPRSRLAAHLLARSQPAAAEKLPIVPRCAKPCGRGFIIIYEAEGYPGGIRRTLKIASVRDSGPAGNGPFQMAASKIVCCRKSALRAVLALPLRTRVSKGLCAGRKYSPQADRGHP